MGWLASETAAPEKGGGGLSLDLYPSEALYHTYRNSEFFWRHAECGKRQLSAWCSCQQS